MSIQRLAEDYRQLNGRKSCRGEIPVVIDGRIPQYDSAFRMAQTERPNEERLNEERICEDCASVMPEFAQRLSILDRNPKKNMANLRSANHAYSRKNLPLKLNVNEPFDDEASLLSANNGDTLYNPRLRASTNLLRR